MTAVFFREIGSRSIVIFRGVTLNFFLNSVHVERKSNSRTEHQKCKGSFYLSDVSSGIKKLTY